MEYIFIPKDNVAEASVIPDIQIIGISSLSEAVSILTGEMPVATI
jgi:predicted ATPase with chaperone activity